METETTYSARRENDPCRHLYHTQHKRQLASLYFPHISTQAARQRLQRLIRRCTPLRAELERMGYDPHRQYFMGQEVRAIVRHLGEP